MFVKNLRWVCSRSGKKKKKKSRKWKNGEKKTKSKQKVVTQRYYVIQHQNQYDHPK